MTTQLIFGVIVALPGTVALALRWRDSRRAVRAALIRRVCGVA
jgi:hypothetical protein